MTWSKVCDQPWGLLKRRWRKARYTERHFQPAPRRRAVVYLFDKAHDITLLLSIYWRTRLWGYEETHILGMSIVCAANASLYPWLIILLTKWSVCDHLVFVGQLVSQRLMGTMNRWPAGFSKAHGNDESFSVGHGAELFGQSWSASR